MGTIWDYPLAESSHVFFLFSIFFFFFSLPNKFLKMKMNLIFTTALFASVATTLRANSLDLDALEVKNFANEVEALSKMMAEERATDLRLADTQMQSHRSAGVSKIIMVALKTLDKLLKGDDCDSDAGNLEFGICVGKKVVKAVMQLASGKQESSEIVRLVEASKQKSHQEKLHR